MWQWLWHEGRMVILRHQRSGVRIQKGEYPKVSTDKTLNIKVQTGFKCFKSNRHSRPLYIYFLTFQYSWQKICSFDNFANDWIRTNELWCRKWPLCRLRHSHCPPMANLEVVNYDSRQFSSQCNASIVNGYALERSQTPTDKLQACRRGGGATETRQALALSS